MRASPQTDTLARSIALRMLAIFLLFAALAAVLVISTSVLQQTTDAMYTSGHAVALSHELEVVILSHRRNTLLYFAGRDTSYLAANPALLRQADRLITALPAYVNDPAEADTARHLYEQYGEFRALATDDNRVVPPERVDRLISALDTFRLLNLTQMAEARRDSARLNSQVDRAMLVVLPLLGFLLLYGAYRFWQTLFHPLVRLSAAARALAAGRTDLHLPPAGSSELASVTGAFNTLADALTAREQDRHSAIAVIAHDLRAPLTVISGTAELLAMNAGEGQRDELGRIVAHCRRLEGMTRDLMEEVRIETGQLALEREPLDLVPLLRETANELHFQQRDRTITLHLPAACRVTGDRLRLQRVVSNLLSNALKYSPQEMPVVLTLTATAQRAMFTVSDQGQGISAEEQARLFQPFSRIERTARHRAGTGLGLYSVRRIIEAHGGSITVESAVGSGSTFIVALPLAGGESAPTG